LIPPSLSSDPPEPVANAAPVVLSLRSDQEELIEPGPVIVTRGVTTQLYAELYDTNLDDILYLRFYVNYTVTDPTPARAACKTSTTDSLQRSLTCDITALCSTGDVGKAGLRLEVEVFDRALADTGTPQYKAMEPDATGKPVGISTGLVYDLTCNGGVL
jgi:hypothetical protein